ncbi:hypothetical protein [uncultured Pseudomonas sp.]|uniref:hypothetical protein n=1 Tax=uncultured Pseudomonas sp. TaxID=114707 RepID=UPI0025898A8D|nr:hypothetical protein [uncultured Pseudomonas sp.]
MTQPRAQAPGPTPDRPTPAADHDAHSLARQLLAELTGTPGELQAELDAASRATPESPTKKGVNRRLR